jgi:uncharacterized protein
VARTEPSSLPEAENQRSLLDRHRWLIYTLPIAVFLLISTIEPSSIEVDGKRLGLAIPYSAYPLIYSVKISLTLVAMAFVLPGYRQFRKPPGLLAVVVGAVGIVVWVGMCDLSRVAGLTPRLDKLLGGGSRPGFDPLGQLAATPVWAWIFMVTRFFGLVLVVPVIEEFFLRGFVMRFVMAQEWWQVPFGTVNAAAVAASVVVPLLMHQPGEYLAAAAWFGLVTWLMIHTRNPWDCVLAHAVTNLLLGIYVVTSGHWELW